MTPPTPTGSRRLGPNVRSWDEPPRLLLPLGRTRTSDGAVEFARYFVSAWDWTYATNSTSSMRGLYLPSCDRCRSLVAALDGLVSKGGQLRNGRIAIATVEVDDRRWTFPRRLKLRYDYAIEVLLDEQETDIRTSPSSRMTVAARAVHNFTLDVFVRWVNGSWRCSYLQGEAAGK